MKKNINIQKINFIYLPWMISPILVIAYISLNIINSVIPTITIIINSNFVNACIELYSRKVGTIVIWKNVALMLVMLVISAFIKEINGLVCKKLYLNMNQTMETLVMEKISKLPYSYIENSKIWDLITRVRENPAKALLEGFDNIIFLVSLLIEIIGFGIILANNAAWWMDAILVIIAIPLVYISIKGGELEYEKTIELSEKFRYLKYISTILTSREDLQERKLFDYSKRIRTRWKKDYLEATSEKIKIHKKWFIRMKITGVIINLTSFLLMLFLLYRIKVGKLSVGIFVAIVNALLSMTQSITWDLSDSISQLSEQKEFLEDLKKFLNLKEIEEENKMIRNIEFESIRFDNVWFKYPDTDDFILKGVSFKIEKGKQYAFVGLNGAGKTTIIKLLMKLYTPCKGRILLNDIALEKYSINEIRRVISIFFQDYAKYQLKIKDIISVGQECTKEKMHRLIKICELEDTIKDKDDGIDTELGKIYSKGQDISGGEWQKLSLARTLLFNTEVVILDEPTSALDAISENHLYEKYRKIFKDKTTIMISHRLASTKLADWIYVLEKGKIIEEGTHEYLLRKKENKYAMMYENQKEWYYE